MTKTYTLEQIRDAFWKKFHASGELWFNYTGYDAENNESTKDHWCGFLEHLDKEELDKFYESEMR